MTKIKIKLFKKEKVFEGKNITDVLKQIIARIFSYNEFVMRILFYRNPYVYWNDRGGIRYFKEQESREDRIERSKFIAKEIVSLNPESVLEVGCGYGRQLKSIRELSSSIKLAGVDFSFSQLGTAKTFLNESDASRLMQSDAMRLPFKDKSFDLVFSSAVILHNPPKVAKRIVDEIARVSKRYIVHNEDRGVSYTRWDYDYGRIYKEKKFRILKNEKIPCAPDPEITQFIVADITGETK